MSGLPDPNMWGVDIQPSEWELQYRDLVKAIQEMAQADIGSTSWMQRYLLVVNAAIDTP